MLRDHEKVCCVKPSSRWQPSQDRERRVVGEPAKTVRVAGGDAPRKGQGAPFAQAGMKRPRSDGDGGGYKRAAPAAGKPVTQVDAAVRFAFRHNARGTRDRVPLFAARL